MGKDDSCDMKTSRKLLKAHPASQPAKTGRGHRTDAKDLAAREEHFRRIVEMAEEGVWTIDAQSLTDYVNPKMAQMMGYAAEEMLGRPIDDFLDDEGRAMLATLINRRKGGIAEQFEFKYVRKDGSYLQAFVSTNPITDAKGCYVGAMALLTDISARRRAEAAMRESEDKFKVIFEQAAVGVAMVDSNTGQFLNVNQRTCDIARLTAEKMKSTTFMDITHPDDLPANLEQMASLKTGALRTFTFEKRYLHADGSITWINLTVSPMWQPGEAPTQHIAIVEDITQRKQAEQALERTTDLLERTGEMARIGGWELDLPSMNLYWSQQTCRLFEVDSLEAPNVDVAISFYATEARPVIRAALEHAILSGTGYELELPVITAKGRRFWARSQASAIVTDGKVVKLTGTFQDITERKQAEEALVESEARFRAIFEQASVGVALMDTNTGRFILVNQRCCEIIGLSSDQLTSGTFMDITHPEDLPAAMEYMHRLRSGAIRGYTIEKRNRLPDGSIRWVNLSISVLAQPGERPARHIAVIEDITQRKKAEADHLRELEFNQTLANQSSVLIVLLDQQGNIVHVNDAAVGLLGYSREELMGHSPWEIGILAPEEKAAARERLKQLLGGKPNPPRETRWIAKGGEEFVVAISSIATRSKDGNIDRIIITGTDLTERNRLQTEILRISEQEQARIGHNLHDGVGQTMTGIASLMDALESELTGDQKTSAGRIRQLVQDAIQEVRQMSHSLSPASVRNRGLGGALQLLAETIRTNHRTACICKIAKDIDLGDGEKETHLYRIAQEAANNALRHGKPGRISISLRRTGEHNCTLAIEDNGTGMSKSIKSGTGIGMRVMDYRANLIGAQLSIRSRPGKGCAVICEYPYMPEGISSPSQMEYLPGEA